jgi:hypothetical protein
MARLNDMNHGKVSAEIANGLLTLKERIKAAKIPSSKLDESINIATWNIREFGKKKRSIAEIVNVVVASTVKSHSGLCSE